MADKGKFATFAAILTRKYGEPSIDRGDNGKVWIQPTAGFRGIALAVIADTANVGYQFANYDACLEEVQAGMAERY